MKNTSNIQLLTLSQFLFLEAPGWNQGFCSIWNRELSEAQQSKVWERNLAFDPLGSFNLTVLSAVKEHQEKEKFCRG